MRTLLIRKFLIIPLADVLNEDGVVIGEWEGGQVQVFRGSTLFPSRLAEMLEQGAPQDKLDALETT